MVQLGGLLVHGHQLGSWPSWDAVNPQRKVAWSHGKEFPVPCIGPSRVVLPWHPAARVVKMRAGTEFRWWGKEEKNPLLPPAKHTHRHRV